MQIVPSASGTENYTLAPLPNALFKLPSSEEFVRLALIDPDLARGPKESCKTCLKKGTFRTRIHDGSVITCECNCREQWILAQNLLSAGIGDAYQRFSWHNVRGVSETVTEVIKSYLANLEAFVSAGVGMILWSEQTGTGKTLLAHLVLKEALAQGHTGYFTNFTSMINAHTSTWNNEDRRAWFADKITNVKVLVIDEMGKENAARSGVVDELLDQVIRIRVAHSRPTFIACNLNPAHTENIGKDFSRYQAGLLDLLRERSLIVGLTGMDYRRTMQTSLVEDITESIRYPVVVR